MKQGFIASASKVVFAVLVSLGGLVTNAPAQTGFSYLLINAKATGQDHGGGNLTGSVIGGGVLHGTLAGNLSVTGVTGTIATFVETVTFTNDHGTLTVVVNGFIDVTTGQYNAFGPITSSTGKLAGATGHLTFSGTVNFATGVSIEDITGVIQVDLAP
jgi:hypothetical protein